ncbi:MAG: hypothetical protein O7E52_15545 [Candidatus Poribacteria bacterium]|nr:hypothetical protein [Candidatus Poribacteria bacterium]
MNSIKLSQLSFLHKLILSFFLFVTSYAYLFAQIHFQFNTRSADGNESGLASIKDIVITYHGDRSKTRLGAKINGSMQQYLPNEASQLAIEAWIAAGRTEQGYRKIQHIFDDNCVRCHPYDERPDYPLETYEEVYAAAEPDRGVSIGYLAYLSYFHASRMGIAAVLLALIFSFSSFPTKIRIVVCALPVVAMLISINSWWFTKLLSPIFAPTVYFGEGLTGLAYGIIILSSLYDMWLKKKKVKISKRGL